MMRNHWNKIDLACIIVIVASYCFLSVSGLNWDHLELAGGYGLDPDSGGISEALGYLYNLQENWRIGGKEYPQGYGILLALFYGIAVNVASFAGKLPPFEIQMRNQPYGRLLMAVAHISTEDGRIFFTLTARGMSSLFGLLTVLLMYVIGRDYFKSRRVGFAAAIMLMSAYPFIIFSQNAKYPATAIFFFLLSTYLSSRLIATPSLGRYFWTGLCAGFAVSIIYFNGVALLVLLLAHIVIITSNNSARDISLGTNKRLFIALFAAGIGFTITNPRILTDGPTLVLDVMEWARAFFATDRRADHMLSNLHGGAAGWMFRIRDDVGLPLLAAMVIGLWVSAKTYSRENALFVFVGLFYLAFSVVGAQSYIVATAYPVLLLLFAHWCIQSLTRATEAVAALQMQFPVWCRLGNRLLSHASANYSPAAHRKILVTVVYGAIVVGISSQGATRITAQNMINQTVSTKLIARQWVQSNLPIEAKYIVDSSGIQIDQIDGRVFHASFVGGSRAVTHSFQDILHASGAEVFSAEYAVTGSDFLEFISDVNVKKYPALERNLSPAGVGYGLVDAYKEYFHLLHKHAVLVQHFPKGNWVGEDQINNFGFLFFGVPWAKLWVFLSDSNVRTQGPSIKIYKLTPEFWRAVEAALFTEKPAAVCTESNSSGAAHNGMLMIEQTAVYDRITKTFAIELCWQSDHKKVMNEVVFSLDYASMLKRDFWYYIKRGISTVLRTNQRHRQIYREYFNLQGDSYRATTTFSVPDNMVKGDYVLRYYFSDDPYNEIELARITQ